MGQISILSESWDLDVVKIVLPCITVPGKLNVSGYQWAELVLICVKTV